MPDVELTPGLDDAASRFFDRRALLVGRTAGRTTSNLVHLASTWAKVRKKLPGG